MTGVISFITTASRNIGSNKPQDEQNRILGNAIADGIKEGLLEAVIRRAANRAEVEGLVKRWSRARRDQVIKDVSYAWGILAPGVLSITRNLAWFHPEQAEPEKSEAE